LLQHLGASPPRGILICGQPGTGKTALAYAICGELQDINCYKLSGPELVSSLSGESESNIWDLFWEVAENAPSVLFIDEIDSIAGKTVETQGHGKWIIAQLISCIDDLDKYSKPVTILATTSK